MSDPEVRKRISSANIRLDQNHLRKMEIDPVESNYSLSVKKLIMINEQFRREDERCLTTRPILTTMEIEELMDPILFRQERQSPVMEVYDFFSPDNVDKNLR